ncbi:fluoride efflux transporter CrcB [Companilactobacillus hulinensis]|uniref:fluoride efflux transporter CrcB n=1 Tax=Companilactobacillus hulinensis TaxID=2486007 RepID=UPI000F780BB4|nr:fluoride efflux transporter CrcB [Companilactobacillus hulinensis]
MQKLKTFLIIFIGAFIGSNLRYGESLLFKTSSGFPYGTLVANLSGALILPFLIHYLQDRFHLSSKMILALSTGLLGSYTTFSTFTADTYRLYQSGSWIMLITYLTITIVGGFICALLGNYLAASRAFVDYAERGKD